MTKVRPRFDSEMPTTGTPPNDTAIPATSQRGNVSCSSQQPAAAEQREENRADVDEHCGGASVGLLLPAGAVRDNEPVLGRELLNGSRKWAH